MYNVPIYIYIYVYISYSCLQILSKHGGARLRCFLQTTDAFSISFFYFFIIRFPWETRVHITYPQQRTNTVSYTRRASRRQQWFWSVGTRCDAPKPRWRNFEKSLKYKQVTIIWSIENLQIMSCNYCKRLKVKSETLSEFSAKPHLLISQNINKLNINGWGSDVCTSCETACNDRSSAVHFGTVYWGW